MKKLGLFVFFIIGFINQALALNVVEHKAYLNTPLQTVGVPDFPPFSYYEENKNNSSFELKGAFINPFDKAAQKKSLKVSFMPFKSANDINLKNFVIDVRSGTLNLIIGVYSNTSNYNGLQMIYPAVVSNPIHIITLPDTQEKIKSTADLKNMKGIAYKNEYFSDFVDRKLKELNITYVDSLYDLYEKLFTKDADFICGSLYYHKIQASRLGIEQYLAYSVKPLYKIPVFMALSQQTPKYSEYLKVFHSIFADPAFSVAIKEEILRIVNEEIEKNIGIVPPAFAKKDNIPMEEKHETTENSSNNEHAKGGHIKENAPRNKSIDEILDGI